MKNTLEHADADDRALATALVAALRQYRGGAEFDDGQAQDFMDSLAAKFDSALNELAIPHTRAGEL